MKRIIRKTNRRTTWIKCPECGREIGVAAGSVYRGKGDNTAYGIDSRLAQECPWCSRAERRIHMRIVAMPPSRVVVSSDCFRHGAFDGVFCPTCEKEAGR